MQTISLKSNATAQTLETLIDDMDQLISLPEVVIKINELVNRADTSVAQIAQVISQDPAIATRILKVANSSMYGGQRQIDTINRAVTLLGTKQIRDLVLTTTAAKVFDGIPNDVISVEDFWHHSLYCALLAHELARVSQSVNADTMFTAGLLHDIGHLVMFHRLPEESVAAILLTIQGEAGMEPYQAERQTLGFDHAQVGAVLASHWGLPDILVSGIGFHHDLHAAPQEHIAAVAHIHIANLIASLPYSDLPEASDLQRITPQAWQWANLESTSIGGAIEAAKGHIGDTYSALFGDRSSG
ncbi:MAG: HDOD domain-containing protein [Thioalkalispiraceae bacterium]|jgi:putative nucleotidyltransferase with HDIG domain